MDNVTITLIKQPSSLELKVILLSVYIQYIEHNNITANKHSAKMLKF